MLLLWIACVSKEEVLTVDSFRVAWAAAACDQLFRCQPDSWATLNGPEACEAEQYSFLTQRFTDQCLDFNTSEAQACLAAFERLPCEEPLIEGEVPDVCRGVWMWRPNCAGTGFTAPG